MTLLRTLLLIASVAIVTATNAADKITSRLPQKSQVVDGYTDRPAIERRLTRSGMARIEGIWTIPSTGAEFAIERTSGTALGAEATTYRIVVLRMPDRAVRPGTIMGYLTPGASSEFDAAIYTSSDATDGTLRAPARFTLKMHDDGTLGFKRVRQRYDIELFRLLPYMFRRVIRTRRGDDGSASSVAIRTFPQPDIPLTPRYL